VVVGLAAQLDAAGVGDFSEDVDDLGA